MLVVRGTRADGFSPLHRMSKVEKGAEKAEQRTKSTRY